MDLETTPKASVKRLGPPGLARTWSSGSMPSAARGRDLLVEADVTSEGYDRLAEVARWTADYRNRAGAAAWGRLR